MTETKTTRRRVTTHVTREQAAQEAEAMTNGKGRSRWIAILIVISILALGGWMIAQRVMPYALDGLQESPVEGMMGEIAMGMPMMDDNSALDAPHFAARDDVLMMVKSAGSMAVSPEMDMVTEGANGSDGFYGDGIDKIASDRKMQKMGNMSIIVDSISWTVEHVAEIAREHGGEVMNAHFYTNERERVRGTMTIRVEAVQFDNVFEKIKKEVASIVKSENINTQDITEQYVDLEAQLKNKKNEEIAFVNILERSGKIDDVLKVTRELSRVRGEIERTEGRLRYLASRTDFSFITLYIEEDEKIILPDTAWRPATVAKQSINRLIADTQQLTDKIIQFLTWFVPAFFLYVLVIVVLWYVVKRIGILFIKRWKRRQKEKDVQ